MVSYMPPAWPEDEYLLLLGKVIYSISSVEGLLIFDLPRMPVAVKGLTPQHLAGVTTTTIGSRLIGGAPSVADPSWRAYLLRGGQALKDLGPKRNRVLHARPATIDGRQRLHRWRLNPPEVVSITPAHLVELLDEVEDHRRVLQSLRPPVR